MCWRLGKLLMRVLCLQVRTLLRRDITNITLFADANGEAGCWQSHIRGVANRARDRLCHGTLCCAADASHSCLLILATCTSSG